MKLYVIEFKHRTATDYTPSTSAVFTKLAMARTTIAALRKENHGYKWRIARYTRKAGL